MAINGTPVAIVTGAGSGIGREVAVLLAGAGFRLALVGRRETKLRETAGLITTKVECLAGDLADTRFAGEIVDDAVGSFGRLDCLVNNAGCAPRLDIGMHTPDIIDSVFRVNATAAGAAIARAWPHWVRAGGGRIVNISSLASIDPVDGFFAYAASKAALNMLSLVAAREGAPHGIRSFCVAPGAVETPMLRAAFAADAFPFSSVLSPREVAQVVLECATGKRDDQSGRTIIVRPERQPEVV